MHRFAITFALSFFVFPAFGAGMAHITSVVDSRTLIIEEEGTRLSIRLAGVVVPIQDEAQAVDFLRRTTASGWVLVERDAAHPGEGWLYRSPDGLFVNGEMNRAGYRDGRTPMMWLGESYAGPREAPAPAKPKVSTRTKSARKVRR